MKPGTIIFNAIPYDFDKGADGVTTSVILGSNILCQLSYVKTIKQNPLFNVIEPAVCSVSFSHSFYIECEYECEFLQLRFNMFDGCFQGFLPVVGQPWGT